MNTWNLLNNGFQKTVDKLNGKNKKIRSNLELLNPNGKSKIDQDGINFMRSAKGVEPLVFPQVDSSLFKVSPNVTETTAATLSTPPPVSPFDKFKKPKKKVVHFELPIQQQEEQPTIIEKNDPNELALIPISEPQISVEEEEPITENIVHEEEVEEIKPNEEVKPSKINFNKKGLFYPGVYNQLLKFNKDIKPTNGGRGFGMKLSGKSLKQKAVKDYLKSPKFTSVVIPTSFDWRTAQSGTGIDLLVGIQDQGQCGSCVAFASTGSLSSVLSIKSDGVQKYVLSSQDQVACGASFSDGVLNNPSYSAELEAKQTANIIPTADWYELGGCDGSLLVSAAIYNTLVGVPLASIVPYTSGSTGKNGNCNNSQNLIRYHAATSSDLTYGNENGFPSYDLQLPPIILASNIQNMQLSIMNNGPIMVGLNVYTNFLYYPQTGAIYRQQSSITIGGRTIPVTYEGAHAVQIVGWGETTDGNGNALPYWICQNQWGTDWGYDGYFFIEKGVNFANIELEAVEQTVDLNSLTYTGSTYPLHTTDQSSDLEWWAWLLIAISIAFVVAIIITVAVVFGTKPKATTPKKVETSSLIQ